MSKSLGNFITIRDLLDEWPGEVVRFNMLRTHYRQPMDWTVAGLREAERTLANWYELAGDVEPGPLDDDTVAALSDDLNTPGAFAALHELRAAAAHGNPRAASRLKATAGLMGLLALTPDGWSAARRVSLDFDEAAITALVEARVAARKAKDFAEADRLRAEIEALGIMLKDAKDPVTGELVTAWEVRR
jgi:cysteinyl-tRNA synthetase